VPRHDGEKRGTQTAMASRPARAHPGREGRRTVIPFVTADQLAAHALGDYVLQSDWMASEKTRRPLAAWVHATVYTMVFIAWFHPGVLAALTILWTHCAIDHWRLARFVVFAKNFLAPRWRWWRWEECSETGYHRDRPAWLAVWLLIIADNVMHVLINAAALRWL
jgi:hypothetical protein